MPLLDEKWPPGAAPAFSRNRPLDKNYTLTCSITPFCYHSTFNNYLPTL